MKLKGKFENMSLFTFLHSYFIIDNIQWSKIVSHLLFVKEKNVRSTNNFARLIREHLNLNKEEENTYLQNIYMD